MSEHGGELQAAGSEARLLRGALARLRALIQPEWILVSLSVLAAALSAFSVWQATTFAEEASDAQNEERVAADRQSEELAAFNVKTDHDLRLLVRYCAALTEQQWALLEAFSGQVDDEGDSTSRLASASRRAELLPLLFQTRAPADCSAAVEGLIPAAHEWEAATDTGFGAADPGRLTTLAAEFGDRETRLMQAGVAFAAALLLLTLADAAANRQRRTRAVEQRSVWPVIWTAAAGVLLAFGLGWLVPSVDLEVPDLIWIAAVLLAGFLVSAPPILRLSRRAADRLRARKRLGSERWWYGRDIGWWAEIVGAAILLMFAATALGFSTSSLRERNSEASADRIDIAADRIVGQRQESAMRDLAFVAELVELHVSDPALANALDPQVQEIEDAARADLRRLGEGDGSECPGSPSADYASTARALLTASETDGTAFADHVVRSLQPGVECAALSAAVRGQARAWGDLRATFTIGLVVLGLAGFLVASAGDRDRSARTAGWLLRVGVVGGLVGVALAAMATFRFLDPTIVEGAGARDSDLREFARYYAAGRTALALGECQDARDQFTLAIDAYDRYPTAYVDRAEAISCGTRESAVLSSAIPADLLPEYLENLERARSEGLSDSRVLGSMGWGYFLRAVTAGEEGDLERARATTTQALGEVEQIRTSEDELLPVAHILRLNLALMQPSTVEDGSHSYAAAFDCLTGAQDCAGGAIADETLRSVFLLSALADVELLAGDLEDHDPRRERILSSYLGGGAAHSPAIPDLRLDVFPQEVQLVTSASAVRPLSIIWYHRATDSGPWAVVVAPSLATYLPGQYLNRPLAAATALPPGEYRADVYSEGALVARVENTGVELATGVRRTVPDLGLTLTLPIGWERAEEYSLFGHQVAFGPDSERPEVFLWRSEGELRWDREQLQAALDEWVVELFDADAIEDAHNPDDPYYLGLSPALWRTYPEIGWSASAGFSSYASSAFCPGTLLMVLHHDDDLGAEIQNSIVLSRSLTNITHLPRVYESAAYGFRINIPETWDAYELPPELGRSDSHFVATDCETGTNLRISNESAAGYTLAEYVDVSYDALAADFPEFELIRRTPFHLPSGLEAEELVFTWEAESNVVQSQIYVIDGSIGVVATFTVAVDELERFEDEYALFVDTFDVLPGATTAGLSGL